MGWDYDKYAGIADIHEIEKLALVGSGLQRDSAVQALIELERRFRSVFDEVWDKRIGDGLVEGYALRKGLEDAIENAISIAND